MSDAQASQRFYASDKPLNSILINLQNSFKKQSGLNKDLSAFIKKNGVPVWDKTIYSLGSNIATGTSTVKTNSTSSQQLNTNSVGTSKGLFLIPLQSNDDGSIQSYITAYKHNDTSYTYRLYNKDSLDKIRPVDDSARAALRSTEAVFGVFEKSINNKDTINISGVQIRNARIVAGPPQGGTTATAKSNGIKLNQDYCLMTVTMTLYFEWHYYSYSYGEHWDLVGISIDIDVSCWSDGTGGSGNQGFEDPNNSNWWDFGTGWPWNNPSLYSQSDPWQFWWSGAQSIPNFYASRTYLDTDDGDENNNDVGNEDNSTYIDYDEITQSWPNIVSVIPINDFVGWLTPGVRVNCMDYAKAQIMKKGYKISDYLIPGQTIQVYKEINGVGTVDINAAKNGVGYLISALQRGIPVIVGIDDEVGSSNPGTDNTTDHFVVIVGAGSDADGHYFTFFDNATGSPTQGASAGNKLYYNSATGKISGRSQAIDYAASRRDYIVTMIRKSKQ
ncbi:MAG: hypothetical protein IM581_04355 [Chitinophagaceae bacterium]|nr:hypothetical protein [Chitinophagaceae bacterium]